MSSEDKKTDSLVPMTSESVIFFQTPGSIKDVQSCTEIYRIALPR